MQEQDEQLRISALSFAIQYHTGDNLTSPGTVAATAAVFMKFLKTREDTPA